MVRRPLPIFPGILNEPILKPRLFPFGIPSGDTPEQRRLAEQKRVFELRYQKLVALLKHYGIRKSGDAPSSYDVLENPWLLLAWRLACDCVPGMQVVARWPIRRARARPRGKWGLELAHRLCPEIDAIRAAKSGRRLSLVQAIENLRKNEPDTWGKYKTTSLKTRYLELRKIKPAHIPPLGLWRPQVGST
jgi:hypothetical protein